MDDLRDYKEMKSPFFDIEKNTVSIYYVDGSTAIYNHCFSIWSHDGLLQFSYYDETTQKYDFARIAIDERIDHVDVDVYDYDMEVFN
jgi:hypothetical protein